MRLSEERINHIAAKMLQQLTQSGSVRVLGDRKRLQIRMAKVILDDLHIEVEIDAEVRRRLRRMASAPAESSPEWEAIFRREKEALCARKGYVI